MTMQLNLVCPACGRTYAIETRNGTRFTTCPECAQNNPVPEPPPGFCRLCWKPFDYHSFDRDTSSLNAVCQAK